MINETPIFEEKQYLGHNRLSIVIRSGLALFCFVAYYWSENPRPVELSVIKIGSYPISNYGDSGLLFFILGVSIIVFSTALTYILHIHTKVYKGYIVLEGFWTSRKVKIDLKNITAIRKSRYKKINFKRGVYNLHNKGVIRFYTSGSDFVELTDNAGFSYRIGSQKIVELFTILKKETNL
ncbi:MAG: hypothetical protein SFY56_14270 [Bacteroidota bacterium]|nr:hypothetical protein [Bacteroidota bacterium]